MTKSQRKMLELKSDLLNFFVHSQDENYITFIEGCIFNRFGIENCILRLKEGWLQHPTNDFRRIPWSQNFLKYEQSLCSPIPTHIHNIEEIQKYHEMVLLKKEQGVYGILFVQTNSLWKEFSRSMEMEEFVQLLTNLLIKEVSNNENTYKKIFQFTRIFHSTLDIDVILENVLATIQENYPMFHAELILSIDQDRQTTLNIKPFDYLKERPSTVEAFVSGYITNEKERDVTLFNVPIKGRQAIYGILQVKVPNNYTFTGNDKEFIRMLATTSGNALENAKLYNQSHRLIRNLQLINETIHRLNTKLDIEDMLRFLKNQFFKTLHPMELCFVMKQDDGFQLTEASAELFQQEEGKFYIQFVAKHFEHSKEPLLIADLSKKFSQQVNYRSIMAVPMIVEQKIMGFSIALHREAYFFSFESYKLMQSLIHHSSLAISNSILRNKLQEMVDYDHLTKLYARSYLDQFVERSLQSDEGGMFLLLDIDNFKGINDTYGHQVGDDVLIQIGNELKRKVGNKGICARWGGEELSVYAPNVTVTEAKILSKKIVEKIPQVTSPKVTVSAGLMTWNQGDRPKFRQLFLQADTALYVAKNKGKNQVCFYDNVKISHT